MGNSVKFDALREKVSQSEKSNYFPYSWAHIDFYSWGCIVGGPWITTAFIIIWDLSVAEKIDKPNGQPEVSMNIF